MVDLKNKVYCCGCTACSAVCPEKCITMVQDSEGFLYPNVEKTLCKNCHLCKKVCPVEAKEKEYFQNENETVSHKLLSKEEITRQTVSKCASLPDAYVAYIKDDDLRKDSTSGGIFTAISQEIINRKGKVYGVAVSEKLDIVHTSVESKEELKLFRGSKYVQSSQEGIYCSVKSDLQQDQWVLYTGTPCQVVGLKRFLAKEYKKLITIDIFCHGVGSPKYWRKYVSYLEQKYGSPIKKVKFREKTYGYNSACMAVYFENGESSHKGHDDDMYWTAFSKFYIFRPSCYQCVFKTINHEADFSVGDFWNAEEVGEKFMKANGCSLLLAHSEKGKQILKEINETIDIVAVDLERALLINGGAMPSKLITSSPQVSKRNDFFKDMDKLDIDMLIKKYIYLSLKTKIKCIIKPLVYKTGLLGKMKKIEVEIWRR